MNLLTHTIEGGPPSTNSHGDACCSSTIAQQYIATGPGSMARIPHKILAN